MSAKDISTKTILCYAYTYTSICKSTVSTTVCALCKTCENEFHWRLLVTI